MTKMVNNGNADAMEVVIIEEMMTTMISGDNDDGKDADDSPPCVHVR